MDSLCEFVRAGEIDGPLADNSIEEPFHEFGEMYDGKIAADLSIFLALRDDFAEKADGGCLGSAQLWGTHRIHGAGENDGLPQRAPHFCGIAQSFVESPQALLGSGLGGQFRLKAFRLAREGTASDLTQNRIFAREIAKKSGLADFQSVHDVVDACVFVAALAEKVQSGFDDLLSEARLLSFTKPGGWLLAGARMAALSF